MGFSVVTTKQTDVLPFLSLFILLFSQPVLAESGRDLFNAVRPQTGSSFCYKRFGDLDEVKAVFAVPSFKPLLQGKSSPEFVDAVQSWSSDLLIKIILQLEQEYLSRCPDPKWLQGVSSHLKRAYLRKLGLPDDRLLEDSLDTIFRSLFVPFDEFGALQSNIQKMLPPVEPVDVIQKTYGTSGTVVQGVLVMASEKEAFELAAFVTKICAGKADCPFWNRNLIYRVNFVGTSGAAAYIPETAVLTLSRELFSPFHLLHQIVVMHELAHAAERSAWLSERKRWTETFVRFSGWKRTKLGKFEVPEGEPALLVEDELVKLSKTSNFSILPDKILPPRKTSEGEKDGFLMAKTVRETKRQNDLSEDLADHVALFKLFPERFCVQGKSIAPQKHAWIRKNLFPETPALKCP